MARRSKLASEIRDAANQRAVLVVSQRRTRAVARHSNDMMFRFVPNDHVEGRATVDLIKTDSKKMIVRSGATIPATR